MQKKKKTGCKIEKTVWSRGNKAKKGNKMESKTKSKRRAIVKTIFGLQKERKMMKRNHCNEKITEGQRLCQSLPWAFCL